MQLTDSVSENREPVVSDDGTRIAFCTNRDLNYDIYVMNIDCLCLDS